MFCEYHLLSHLILVAYLELSVSNLSFLLDYTNTPFYAMVSYMNQ